MGVTAAGSLPGSSALSSYEALAGLLDGVAAGRFPPPDGSVTVLPQPSQRHAAVLAFSAHAVILTDADPGWVRDQLPRDDLSAPLSPAFLAALCAQTGRRVRSADMVCVASALPGRPGISIRPSAAVSHPRVARALRYRDDVRVWQAAGGLVTLGRGIADRWEVSVEVEPGHRGKGLGRQLVAAARQLAPDGAPVWAQIAPGNAASVRAFLAAGYAPAGAEAMLTLS